MWGANADSERIAEYCVQFLDDNTYLPMLIKDLDEPIKEWNYPDSVVCKRISVPNSMDKRKQGLFSP